MKFCLPLLLLLAACAPTRPPHVSTWPTQISPVDSARLAAERRVFEGHPPVEMLELEAAPDSITIAEAQYWTQQARHWAQAVKKLPKSHLK